MISYIKRDIYNIASLKNILEADQLTSKTCPELVLEIHPNRDMTSFQTFMQEVKNRTRRRVPNTETPFHIDALVPNFNDDFTKWQEIEQSFKQIPDRNPVLLRYDLSQVSSLHSWADSLLKDIDTNVKLLQEKGPERNICVNIICYSAGSIIVRLALQKLRKSNEYNWKCNTVIMLAPAIFGSSLANYTERSSLPKSPLVNLDMFDTVESVVTRIKPTSAFIHQLAAGDIFLPEEEQFFTPEETKLFVIQGTKQFAPFHEGKKPLSGSAFRGSDGIVPYSASGMKAVKWYLDLDNNVDPGETEGGQQNIEQSTVKCHIRYCPNHDHLSLLNSFFEQKQVYHQVR